MTIAAEVRTTPCVVLESGDHMDAAEFHRRYLLHPYLKKAELIDGVVYVPSPARSPQHGNPQFRLIGKLSQYSERIPGVTGDDNATLRLGPKNEPQPDVMLRWDAAHGGRSRLDEDGYVTGVPDLIAEISGSSHSYDLHEKKELYRRIGVQEYLVWQTEDGRIDWWELAHGEYVPLPVDADGFIRSRVFPGLVLNPAELLGP